MPVLATCVGAGAGAGAGVGVGTGAGAGAGVDTGGGVLIGSEELPPPPPQAATKTMGSSEQHRTSRRLNVARGDIFAIPSRGIHAAEPAALTPAMQNAR